jgi:hypothetical protein
MSGSIEQVFEYLDNGFFPRIGREAGIGTVNIFAETMRMYPNIDLLFPYEDDNGNDIIIEREEMRTAFSEYLIGTYKFIYNVLNQSRITILNPVKLLIRKCLSMFTLFSNRCHYIVYKLHEFDDYNNYDLIVLFNTITAYWFVKILYLSIDKARNYPKFLQKLITYKQQNNSIQNYYDEIQSSVNELSENSSTTDGIKSYDDDDDD